MTTDDLPEPLDELLEAPVPPRRLSPVDVEIMGGAIVPAPDVIRYRRDDGVELSYYRWQPGTSRECYLIEHDFAVWLSA